MRSRRGKQIGERYRHTVSSQEDQTRIYAVKEGNDMFVAATKDSTDFVGSNAPGIQVLGHEVAALRATKRRQRLRWGENAKQEA